MPIYDRRPSSIRKQGVYTKGCRVPDCNQNHNSHYCKLCRDSDSDHFSSNCQYQQNNRNRNLNKSSLYSHYNNRQSSTNKNNFQQKKCRVKECNQSHFIHFCKICLDKDSTHFSSRCPNKHINGYGQYSQNNHMNTRSRQYQNNRFQGEQNSYGYKNQNDYGYSNNNNSNYNNNRMNNHSDYDNQSSNGYRNKQVSVRNNINNQNNKKCSIKQCRQFHQKHQCKVCRDLNSDHFYQDCPNGIILFNAKSKNLKGNQKNPQKIQFQNQQGSFFISHWETVLKLLNQGYKIIKYKIKNQFNFMEGVTPNWLEQVKTQHHKGYFINNQNIKKLDYIENVY